VVVGCGCLLWQLVMFVVFSSELLTWLVMVSSFLVIPAVSPFPVVVSFVYGFFFFFFFCVDIGKLVMIVAVTGVCRGWKHSVGKKVVVWL